MSTEDVHDKHEPIEITDSMRLTMRSYFSVNHLTAAAKLALVAKGLEDSFTSFDGEKATEHKGAVYASIMMSVAACEAFINEFLADCADKHGLANGINPEARASIGQAWQESDLEKKEILEKYKEACVLAGKPINVGSAAAHGVKVGIKIRNALMHYKVQSIDFPLDGQAKTPEGDWAKVEKWSASQKLKPSPFATARMAEFPHRLLSHDCAAWIFESVYQFMVEFDKHLGINAFHFRISGAQCLSAR